MSDASRGPLVAEIEARIAAGEAAEAVAAVVARIHAEPERAAALHALAERELQSGAFEVGETIIEALVEVAPDAERLSDLGAIKHVRGDHALAEALLLESLSVAPDYGLAMLNLAALYLDCGRLGDAVRASQALLFRCDDVAAELLYQLADRFGPVAADQADRIAAVAVGRAAPGPEPREITLVVPGSRAPAREPQPTPRVAEQSSTTHSDPHAVFSIGGGAAS